MYNVAITTYTYEVSGYNDRLNRKTEDSLENTFSCVPKVQGDPVAESLRQADGDAKWQCMPCGAVLCEGTAFLFVFYRKKEHEHA